ncbi:thiosulfate/3-mercaptopyruvate sulfurtransferase [Mumia flava]|uniref:Sulfurtransferase n=1 Tax=Mumia flava TaxID=1348852 RepID=A0A0B2BCW0_9ACTN|nr:sulfurtransferase [Mumia flava]PJJ55931.1 thiosulfate/3-mercaptopyruvate sulfurtransferase [Mumia flava]
MVRRGQADVSDPVISAAQAADLLNRPDPGEHPTVLDVRWSLTGPPGLAAYEAGHMPGAVFVDLDAALADPPDDGRGRHPLPDPDRFVAAMRAAGVSADRPVIVYDGGEGSAAARAWWLLTDYGHATVTVLDGGYDAWRAAGLPVSAEAPVVAPGDFAGTPGALPVVDAAGAAQVAAGGILLDARTGERFRGEAEPIDPVAGHVPGAVSAPAGGDAEADGRWRSVAALRARYAGLGIGESGAGSGTREVAAYCGSGVTAARTVLALRRIGIDAALYAGSWSEWIADPSRPVATGDEPADERDDEEDR